MGRIGDVVTRIATEFQGRGAVAIALSPDAKSIAWAPYMPGKAVIFATNGRYDPKPAPIVTKKDKKTKTDKKTKPTKKKSAFDTPLTLNGHKAQMCALQFSPDGKWLFTSSADERVIAWSLPSGEMAFAIELDGFVNAIAATGDGKRLVTGTGGEIAVFNAMTGDPDRVLRPSSGGRVEAMAPVGKDRVAVVRSNQDGGTSRIELWNAASKATKPEAIADLAPLADSARSVCASPDGAIVCVGTNKGTILVLERV